ncbi:MFS family permease [Arthrobacter sp. UYCu712]
MRSQAQRSRSFAGILVNTALANITTSYLWFALTFWVYLQTRNVIATGVIGGAYMLLIALSSISFGTYVDRYRKLAVMRFAGGFTHRKQKGQCAPRVTAISLGTTSIWADAVILPVVRSTECTVCAAGSVM